MMAVMQSLRGQIPAAQPNRKLSDADWNALFEAYMDPDREVSVETLLKKKAAETGQKVSRRLFYRKLKKLAGNPATPEPTPKAETAARANPSGD